LVAGGVAGSDVALGGGRRGRVVERRLAAGRLAIDDRRGGAVGLGGLGVAAVGPGVAGGRVGGLDRDRLRDDRRGAAVDYAGGGRHQRQVERRAGRGQVVGRRHDVGRGGQVRIGPGRRHDRTAEPARGDVAGAGVIGGRDDVGGRREVIGRGQVGERRGEQVG